MAKASREYTERCYWAQTDNQGRLMQSGIAMTLPVAAGILDPFNDETYWPLRNVIPYLGRMGVDG